jgi:hypothetical protein
MKSTCADSASYRRQATRHDVRLRSPLEIALRRATAQITADRFEREYERMQMSRLGDKLEKARGVVGRVSANIEARADEVIAREDVINRRTDEAFAGHYEHLDDATAGLDALERELGQISNAVPSRASGASPAATGAVAKPETVTVTAQEVGQVTAETFRAAAE